MKLAYLNIAGGVVAVLLAAALASVENGNAKMRAESGQFLQVVDSLQARLSGARQTLQSQQEKINKGSAISESVGPAVVADIRAFSERSNNEKLRALLKKHGAGVTEEAGSR